MEQKAYYVGHSTFKSKSGNQLYVLQFVSQSNRSDNSGVEASLISVFVNRDIFETFIVSNDFFDETVLSVRIVGDKVYYDLSLNQVNQ